VLRAQTVANPKEQFGNSPSLNDELMNAIMNAMIAHENMSKQALNSVAVRARLLTVLLGPGELWEDLRGEEQSGMPGGTSVTGLPGLLGAA
jgi:type I restriction enzyme R subunit